MKIPYDNFSITELNDVNDWGQLTEYDYFFSSYNLAERVIESHKRIQSKEKHWIILSNIDISSEKLPNDHLIHMIDCELGEGVNMKDLIESLGSVDWPSKRICIDVTGFIKPWLFAFLREFLLAGVKTIDCLYTEPIRYSDGARTRFSGEVIKEVRVIQGFEGSHDVNTSEDILLIGAGYDFESIKFVSEDKDRARKFLALGFPPLKADMFQENLLQVYEAEESLSVALHERVLLAPANDPFVTARVISDFIETEKYTNLYLSPLATEAQALGFALYYLLECMDMPVSMLFPVSESYPASTSVGIARGWVYHIEFP
ncbi:hypothetical protein IQ258_19630 [Coleofasciculus sp. LEGE 07081]|uniref:hypothetical protein n=1 Tax=Coleofasciculus sp. LEGE 07081 TaxID=2777967 RepID=UPI0018815C6C|nr:hypothetical protein [Coleofasciculus sp. LEGE 07081]MBE9128314.1 hypothetical protein [Coleofasciculus sp. LEGE 07081]